MWGEELAEGDVPQKLDVGVNVNRQLHFSYTRLHPLFFLFFLFASGDRVPRPFMRDSRMMKTTLKARVCLSLPG